MPFYWANFRCYVLETGLRLHGACPSNPGHLSGQMAARRWDAVRKRNELLCSLAVKLTANTADSQSTTKVADALLALKDAHFHGLAALVEDREERSLLEYWLKKSSRDTIRKAVGRAFVHGVPGPKPQAAPGAFLSSASETGVPEVGRQVTARISPLWLVGLKQRNDLDPSYSPVAPDYRGNHLPVILNRGKLPIRDIECRIGPQLRLYAEEIAPGERGFPKCRSGEAYVYAADLFGGLLKISEAEHFGEGREFPQLRLEFEARYRYGNGPERRLIGDLIGDVRRGFYRFEPAKGDATPLYG
jgi:hypothetical protein